MNTDQIIAEYYRHKKLTLHEGAIHEIHNNHVAAQQMVSAGTTVIEKLGFHEHSHDAVSYSFRLSLSPDEVWRAILGAVAPEAPIKIEGDRLQITTAPSELEQVYVRTKKSIEQTNATYTAAIPAVRRLAEAQDAARLNQKKRAEEHRKQLGDALDRLRL